MMFLYIIILLLFVSYCALAKNYTSIGVNYASSEQVASIFGNISSPILELFSCRTNPEKEYDIRFVEARPEIKNKNSTYTSNKENKDIYSVKNTRALFRNYMDHKKDHHINFLRGDNTECLDNVYIHLFPFIQDHRNFIFSRFDFCSPNVISYPGGPTAGNKLNLPHKYWIKDGPIKNNNYYNKVFWCGTYSHKHRVRFLNFYKRIKDERFDVKEFKVNVYNEKELDKSKIYYDYIDKISHSDFVYILRGDRYWTNSFHDIIRVGAIPIFLSSMNDMGWENIFHNVDDYFLRFDIATQNMADIHQEVIKVLSNSTQVLKMKQNIAKFYQLFFSHTGSRTWAEFVLSKMIEIYKNDFDIYKVDNKLVSKTLLEFKGLKNKL